MPDIFDQVEEERSQGGDVFDQIEAQGSADIFDQVEAGAFTDEPEPYNPARDPNVSDEELGSTKGTDYSRTLAKSLDRAGQLMGRVVQTLAPIAGPGADEGARFLGRAIENKYKEREQEIEAMGVSPRFEREISKTFFIKDKDGKTHMGPAWTSAPKILSMIVESAPSTAMGMGTGAALTKGFMGPAVKTLQKLGISEKLAATLGPKIAGVLGGAIGEGTQGGMEAASDAYDLVKNAPIDQVMASPEFKKELGRIPIESDLTQEERVELALQRLARKIALKTGLKCDFSREAL